MKMNAPSWPLGEREIDDKWTIRLNECSGQFVVTGSNRDLYSDWTYLAKMIASALAKMVADIDNLHAPRPRRFTLNLDSLYREDYPIANADVLAYLDKKKAGGPALLEDERFGVANTLAPLLTERFTEVVKCQVKWIYDPKANAITLTW